MIEKDDDLKSLYREHVRGRAETGRRDCPDPETLAEIILPGAKIDGRKELLDHIGGCPHCSRELRLLLDIQKESGIMIERFASGRARRFRGIGRAWFSRPVPFPRLAAAAFALIGLSMMIASIYVLLHRQLPRMDLRSETPAISLLAPFGEIPLSRPILFEWRPLADADAYVLEIFDGALLPVWTSPMIPNQRFLLPEKAAQRLRPEEHYYWMVSAFSRKEKISESALAHVVLRR